MPLRNIVPGGVGVSQGARCKSYTLYYLTVPLQAYPRHISSCNCVSVAWRFAAVLHACL